VVGASYDLVVIDCPPRQTDPRVGKVQESAMMASHLVLLPCGPSPTEAWALTGSVDLVREAQTYREGLDAVVLITRRQARTTLGEAARAVLQEAGLTVLAAELGQRVAYQEAIAAGRGWAPTRRRTPLPAR